MPYDPPTPTFMMMMIKRNPMRPINFPSFFYLFISQPSIFDL